MSENIVRSDEMRLRMTQLEYNDLSEEEYRQEIERIYLEEYGEKLPADIEIYPSSKAPNLRNDPSGYEGTAVHFQSDENNTDEIYIISQGTDDKQDMEYDINAMLAGQDAGQARTTNRFVKDTKSHFKATDNTSVIGLSHSLALNNNATAHLMNNSSTFDDIYGVNGAQTNYYQLYKNDDEFMEAVNEKFSISDPEEIYDVSPNKLKSFAKNYFEEAGEDIHQVISEDDPLYAVSGTRGFFTLGDVTMVDANPDYPGLRDIMDDLPDEDAKEVQELAIQYASATQDGDMDDGIQELTGVNVKLVNKLQGDDMISTYFTRQQELDQMVHDMNDKVPHLLDQVRKVTTNSDAILQKFVDAGYIDSSQKDLITEELTNIEHELTEVEDTLSEWNDTRNQSVQTTWYGSNAGSPGAIIFKDLSSKDSLLQHKDAILDSFDRLNQKSLRSVLNMIIGEHSISSVLKAVSDENTSYKGNDMLLTGTGESGDIQVNMSAAMRMYHKGKSLLDEKKEEIKKLQSAVEREIPDCYKQEKRKVQKQVDNIEANPNVYAFLFTQNFPLLSMNKEVKHIHVAEEFDSLEHADMEEHIDHLNDSVEKGKTYIESYRSSIEDLFDKEEKVAAMFHLAEDVLG